MLKHCADLDHLFKPCGGWPSSRSMHYERRKVDKTFTADILDRLKRH